MTNDKDKTIDKIRKLLRLSNSPNHHEAMAALLKAHELANAAGIAIDGIDPEKERVRISHQRGTVQRMSNARKHCVVTLRMHFGVDVLHSQFGCIYVGPDVNIEIAKHVETFLLRVCSREWADFVKINRIKNTKAKLHRKASFEVGFFIGVRAVLKERPIRNDVSEIRAQVEKYVAQTFVTKSMDIANKSGGTVNMHDRYSGFSAGFKVNLTRPVNDGESRKMIGG